MSDLLALGGPPPPASGFPSSGFADGGPPEGFDGDAADPPDLPGGSSVDFAGALECWGLPERWLFELPVGEAPDLAPALPFFALPRERPLAFGFDFDLADEVLLGCGDDLGSGEPVDGAGSAVGDSPAGSGAGAEGGCACPGGACPVGS